MRIDAYIGNPVIATQEQYYELEELLHEIDPDCKMVQLWQDVVVIENIARRTFHYPRSPSVHWVCPAAIYGRKRAVNAYGAILRTYIQAGETLLGLLFHEPLTGLYAGEKEAKSRFKNC